MENNPKDKLGEIVAMQQQIGPARKRTEIGRKPDNEVVAIQQQEQIGPAQDLLKIVSPTVPEELAEPTAIAPLTRDWVRKVIAEDIGKEHLKFVDILPEQTKPLRLELLEQDQGYLKYSAKLLDNGNIEVAFKVMLPPHSPGKFSLSLKSEDMESTEALYKLFLKKIAKDYLWERDEEAGRKTGHGLTNSDYVRIREMAQDIQKAFKESDNMPIPAVAYYGA